MSNVLNMVSEESFIAQTEKIVKAIGGGSTPFRLLPGSTAVTVQNGSFSVNYEGEAPAVQSATLILPDLPQGLVANSNWNVGFTNGVASFTAIHAATDTTYSGTGFAVIGDTAYKCTFSGMPVGYADGLVQPGNPNISLDFSKDNIVDLTNVNGTRCVYGEKELRAFIMFFDEGISEWVAGEFEVNNNGVLIYEESFSGNGSGYLFITETDNDLVPQNAIVLNLTAAE